MIELLKIKEIDLKIITTDGQSPPLTITSGNLYAREIHNSAFVLDNDFNSKILPKIIYESLFKTYCHFHRLKTNRLSCSWWEKLFQSSKAANNRSLKFSKLLNPYPCLLTSLILVLIPSATPLVVR